MVNLNKQHRLLFAGLMAVNLLTYLWLLPYAQETANQHINMGPFLGAIYYALSVVMLLLGIRSAINHKGILSVLLYAGFILSLCMYGYQLSSLYCLGCANCG